MEQVQQEVRRRVAPGGEHPPAGAGSHACGAGEQQRPVAPPEGRAHGERDELRGSLQGQGEGPLGDVEAAAEETQVELLDIQELELELQPRSGDRP